MSRVNMIDELRGKSYVSIISRVKFVTLNYKKKCTQSEPDCLLIAIVKIEVNSFLIDGTLFIASF